MKHKIIISYALSLLVAFTALSGCISSFETEHISTQASTEQLQDDTAQLTMSHASGFYEKSITLSINAANPDAVIYYTMDGSVPDENSILYTKSIKLTNRTGQANILSTQENTVVGDSFTPKKDVTKANVIRAVAIYPDGSISEVYSRTYFIGINREKEYGSVPVISIMTDSDNLFDYETGIYTTGKTYDDWLAADDSNRYAEGWQAEANFTNRGKEWERPVSFEYIPANGSEGINQDLGIRIMGAASRNAYQKSLRLTARSDYGEKSVSYELLPDNERSDGNGNVTQYKSFVLRNGGNDCDYAKIRDPLFHTLTSGRSYETQQSAPCVVFINGEYWGMYTLTEDYSDNYIENNYGIDNKNVIIVKRGEIEEGEDSDIDAYYEMYDFIAENDMSIKDNYEKACSLLDMQSYIELCALNFYINNEDGILKDNNWRMWRVRETDNAISQADGKWRCMLYDTDYSSGIYSGGQNYRDDNISAYIKAADPEPEYDDDGNKKRPQDKLFSSLLANESFVRELVITLCDMRNYDLSAERSLEKITEYNEIYGTLVPDTFKRFGPEWIARNDTEKYYEEKILELATFMDGRYSSMPQIIQKAFGLDDAVNSQIGTSDSSKGTVYVNSTPLPLENMVSGKYFQEYPITVKAVSAEGHSFKEWKTSGCSISDLYSSSAEITITGDFTIEAIFE